MKSTFLFKNKRHAHAQVRAHVHTRDHTHAHTYAHARTRYRAGLLTFEILISISLFSIFTISIIYLDKSIDSMKLWSINELEKMNAGNLGDFNIIRSDYIESWGGDNCDRNISINENGKYIDDGYDIGSGNMSTDIEVRNSIIYLSANSSTVSDSDLFIIDTSNATSTKLLSKINTGSGINAIALAGPYIYIAQASTAKQLQILDIKDRHNPMMVSQLKLPTPNASTTPPISKSIAYSKGYIYLGTPKWNGAEFSIIDISNVYDPRVVGILEIGSQVNDIKIQNNTAYIATSDINQMQVIDISNKSNPIRIGTFSSSGWQTQEGKYIDIYGNDLILGRTVGGFNITSNHELFILSTTTLNISKSIDIPGGVYSISVHNGQNIILTHQYGHELQVWDRQMNNKIFEIPINTNASVFSCDNGDIYFSTANSRGFSIFKSK